MIWSPVPSLWQVCLSPKNPRPVQIRRQAPRWSHTSPLVEQKTLCCDVTVTCPLAESYINTSAWEPGAAAELAASRKEENYADLDGRYIFELIGIKTLGVLNTLASQLLFDLGRNITESTGEAREASFLFQRCLVLVQRFNAILLHDSLSAQDCTDWMIVLQLPRDYFCRG